MRFHQPDAPIDGNLVSAVESAIASTTQRRQFYGAIASSDTVDGIADRTAFNWSPESGERDALNNSWRAADSATRLQSISDAPVRRATNFRHLGQFGYMRRYTLAGGGNGLFLRLVAEDRNPPGEALRLFVEDGDARAAYLGSDNGGAIFYIERQSGRNLAGVQIVTFRGDGIQFAFRAAVGRGKWVAEPTISRVAYEEVRNKRRGIFSNLTFTNFYQSPRLSLQWNFNNHPSSEDGRSVAALVAASRSTQRGFLLWTGGNELFHRTKPAPPSETAWHDILVERRMVIDSHQGGGGAFSGARIGAGFTGAVSIAETA